MTTEVFFEVGDTKIRDLTPTGKKRTTKVKIRHSRLSEPPVPLLLTVDDQTGGDKGGSGVKLINELTGQIIYDAFHPKSECALISIDAVYGLEMLDVLVHVWS